MEEAAPTPDEAARLASLRLLDLLDTPADERFDRITRMAQRLFGAPIALVSLVDEDRQWFKSRQGLEETETPRRVSFCAHAIHGSGPLVVPDAHEDPRFSDNPLVTGDPHIRFYAGCPIAAPDGAKVGTLCVIDRRPHRLDQDDLTLLRDLADMVEEEIAATHLSVVDHLTGLANRRGFQMVGTKVLEVSRRLGTPAVLIYADMDRLKPINDELGHAAGDRAIVAAAGLLAGVLRASDVVARLGGDEFAALLSGTHEAAPLLGRLREAVARRNATDGDRPALSLSLGSAAFDPGAPVDLDGLLAAADADMYAGRAARRPEGGERAGRS